ncbi:guanine nucleotide binding protein 3 [Heterostelium album PN500]|uniref:Guanine nucleotide binding protein 3 n=1 Tax=Heterostelium pallidum (strain ATCC 26659 / Pp 5 / PN500) TaxID=670386 RepID=D3B2F1_HETP5|nr:guanine nucleotide binding protein 3 [Heterostelium album PN500]EFA84526.1 guanine nucleotide binding protein 3 [Heterostelium album PN500]|eukprot:XP_020436639.1 guanine nucleotide binding protein 3 [Heterostelium album PN500]
MPKKRQSKRVSLHKKYKVEKKVNEHNRKLRKAHKLAPILNKSKKDPGIPNLYPFKEDLLNRVQQQKEAIAAEKAAKKAERKTMASLAKDAASREKEFNRKQRDAEKDLEMKSIRSVEPRDNSLKSFYREVKKVIEAADVILEVLDARDPMGCRCLEIERMILERYPNKKIVLILNKIDLVPKENVVMWLKYLRNYFPTLAFKCSTQQQKRNLGHSSVAPEVASTKLLDGSECLGGESLLQLLKNYSRSLNIKTSVAVGIIGYPNVGKSSLINSLKRARAVSVAPTPGHTKVAQEVHLDKNVKLLDSPGIVPIKGEIDANVILRNVVKVEKIEDPISPVDAIVQRCSREQLLRIYQIPVFKNTTEFLTLIADKRKKLIRGGTPDLNAAALSVIRDWVGGNIPFHTLPPKDTFHVDSKIVNNFSDEFNIDQSDEISSLATNNTVGSVSIESTAQQSYIDTSMFDDEEEEEEEEDDDEMEEEEDDDMEEEEEDDEDDDDEEDNVMEEDTTAQLVALQKQSQMIQQNKGKPSKVKVQNLKDEDDQYNPQSNKSLKKQMKKNKKKFGTITAPSEDYSFESDFYDNLEEDDIVQDDDEDEQDYDDSDDIDEENVF